MKNKVKIIACYYGALPPEFGLWLKSCANNPEFCFLLVTDNQINKVPENVEVYKISLKDLGNKISKVCKKDVLLENPYKLCDYRPLYGIVFKENLKGFHFWGHCDLDMIWGNINHFITDKLLDQYDRIGTYGHLVLYRNCPEMNFLYKKNGAAFSYKTVFSSNYHYNFDEIYGMNMICKKNHISWLNMGHEYCLDKMPGERLAFYGIPNYKNQFVMWKKGRIYQYCEVNNKRYKKEKIYYHFSGAHYVLDEAILDNVLFDGCSCWNKGTGRKNVVNDAGGGGINTWRIRWKELKQKYKSKDSHRKYIAIKQKCAKLLLDFQT